MLFILNGKVSLGSKILGNGFLLYLTGLIGFIGILSISATIKNNKQLTYIGKNSFCIMAVHYFIYTYLVKIIDKLGFIQYSNINYLHTLLAFIIVFALSILATIVYNYFKNLIFKKKLTTKTTE